MQFSGEGIQHVALLTDNLIETVDSCSSPACR
jgi:4-hydroxyphenylpyruvate dioxygenase-like putative hemolysin